MNADQKAFLDAEESAERLVGTLDQLKTEIESFETAKNGLSAVRDKLERFIEASASVGADTREIVQILKRIGGPEIMQRIAKAQEVLEDRLAKVEATIMQRTGRLQVMMILVGLIALAATVFSVLPFTQ